MTLHDTLILCGRMCEQISRDGETKFSANTDDISLNIRGVYFIRVAEVKIPFALLENFAGDVANVLMDAFQRILGEVHLEKAA